MDRYTVFHGIQPSNRDIHPLWLAQSHCCSQMACLNGGLDVWYIWDAINKLVGGIPPPLKNISQLGRIIQYIVENKTCSKPPTSNKNTSTWLRSTRLNKKHLGGKHVYKATHTPLLAMKIRILGRDRKLKNGIHWPTKVEVPTVGWLHLRLCW